MSTHRIIFELDEAYPGGAYLRLEESSNQWRRKFLSPADLAHHGARALMLSLITGCRANTVASIVEAKLGNVSADAVDAIVAAVTDALNVDVDTEPAPDDDPHERVDYERSAATAKGERYRAVCSCGWRTGFYTRKGNANNAHARHADQYPMP